MRKIEKNTLVIGSKITIAAILAILVAESMELQFSSTAGIIIILGIQKKETLKTAARRGRAFCIALLISFPLLSFWIVLILLLVMN